MTGIRREEGRGTSPPLGPEAPDPQISTNPPVAAGEAGADKTSADPGSRASGPGGGGAPVFKITAVKHLCRQEQEDWWAAILADRVSRTTLFSLREDQKTFQYWSEMAVWPGYDMNVVQGPAGERLAFFWTSPWSGLGAFFHFGFLSAGLPWKMQIGRYVLKILALAGYKCLAGLTPAFNHHVVAYGLALGAKVMGRWPGVCYIAARGEFVDGVMLQFVLSDKEA